MVFGSYTGSALSVVFESMILSEARDNTERDVTLMTLVDGIFPHFGPTCGMAAYVTTPQAYFPGTSRREGLYVVPIYVVTCLNSVRKCIRVSSWSLSNHLAELLKQLSDDSSTELSQRRLRSLTDLCLVQYVRMH